MTPERISELAKEAGIDSVIGNGRSCGTLLKTFTRMVEKEEREACAKLVDVMPGIEAWEIHGGQETIDVLRDLAAAIRARSNARNEA